uniref:Death domain-containing protein n=1 Tax=Amphimedon queenslandica TaxID=400682 RepID=A0A1X7VGV9_AMPQE
MNILSTNWSIADRSANCLCLLDSPVYSEAIMDRDSEVFTRPASKEITEEELVTMSMFLLLPPDILAWELNIPKADWSCIRQDYRDSTRAMIREVLLKWLERHPAPTPTFGDLHKLMTTGFELSDSEYDKDSDTVTFRRSPEKKRLGDVGHIQREVSDSTITDYLLHKKKRESPEKDRFYPISRHDESEVERIVKRKTGNHRQHSKENSPRKRAKRESQTKLERRCSPRKPLAGKINQ